MLTTYYNLIRRISENFLISFRMKIDRLFAGETNNPYDKIEFDKRSSVIRNPDGSIVFEMIDIVVPTAWSQVATDIIAQKYFRKAGIPRVLKRIDEESVPVW